MFCSYVVPCVLQRPEGLELTLPNEGNDVRKTIFTPLLAEIPSFNMSTAQEGSCMTCDAHTSMFIQHVSPCDKYNCCTGYIMDRRVGNTKKMGALFGILAAIGGPIPEPETIPYAFFILSNRLSDIFKSEFVVVLLNVSICPLSTFCPIPTAHLRADC